MHLWNFQCHLYLAPNFRKLKVKEMFKSTFGVLMLPPSPSTSPHSWSVSWVHTVDSMLWCIDSMYRCYVTQHTSHDLPYLMELHPTTPWYDWTFSHFVQKKLIVIFFFKSSSFVTLPNNNLYFSFFFFKIDTSTRTGGRQSAVPNCLTSSTILRASQRTYSLPTELSFSASKL